MVRRLATLTAFGVLGLAAGSVRADDQEKFQGTWKPEKAVKGGNAMPAEEIEKMSIEFKGNKARPRHGDKEEKEAEFTLDGSKKPKHIDVMAPDGKTIQGIYEFDGDTLKICFSESGRPDKFESAEGSNTMFIVLKKQKK